MISVLSLFEDDNKLVTIPVLKTDTVLVKKKNIPLKVAGQKSETPDVGENLKKVK